MSDEPFDIRKHLEKAREKGAALRAERKARGFVRTEFLVRVAPLRAALKGQIALLMVQAKTVTKAEGVGIRYRVEELQKALNHLDAMTAVVDADGLEPPWDGRS
jgi:hypothetical protein